LVILSKSILRIFTFKLALPDDVYVKVLGESRETGNALHINAEIAEDIVHHGSLCPAFLQVISIIRMNPGNITSSAFNTPLVTSFPKKLPTERRTQPTA